MTFGPGITAQGLYPDMTMVYAQNVTQTVRDQVTALIQNPAPFGGWTPLPIPDYDRFKHDVITDPNAASFPFVLVMALALAEPSLNYADRKTLASKFTPVILAAYPTQGPAILSTIANYAANRNLPLV